MGRLARLLALFFFTGPILAGCSSSGGGGGGGSISLSGTILGPAGTGVSGVVVQVISGATTAQATTDADGNFIVLQPPTGLVNLHIDGSGAPGGTFASLEIALVIGGGASNLPQPVVLPDLSAGTTVSVPVDASGMTMGDMTVTAPDGSALDIPDMTTILVDGAIPAGSVDVNVTPVEAINVPMMLPGSQDPGAFVTIQPPNATFSPALGITLPNTRGLPLGTMVDIWSFDHQDGAWVNRSQQTGNQGTVVDIGGMTFIVAMEVITEGGWHAGTIPVDPACATTLEGQVFPLGSSTPLADALISLSTGQFTSTDANGRFSVVSVPAYDASMLPKVCQAADLELRAIAPVSFGAMMVNMTISAGSIVTGGTTTLAPFDIPVVDTGSLVGSVIEDGQGVAGTVSISGTSKLDVESDSFGSFFVAALDPGPYTASFPFTNGEQSEDFTITAHATTVVELRSGPPPTGGALTVQVLDFSDTSNPAPVADACVTLQGSSGAPQFQTTNASGVASFASAPSGPYNVTAQKDFTTTFGIGRLASTVVGANPTATPRTVVIPFFDDGGFASPVSTDASLRIDLANTPVGSDIFYLVETESGGGFNTSGPIFGDTVTAPIPSGLPLDVAVWAADPTTGTIQSLLLTFAMAGVGETVLRPLDFAQACPFDQAVTVTYSNIQSHNSFFADLELQDSGHLDLPFTDGSSLPTSILLPDLSNAKLSPFDVFFNAGSENFGLIFEESFCDTFLDHTTPTTIAVDFLGTPTIISPANNAVFSSYGTGSVVQFTLGSGNGTTSGFNNVTFVGESKAADLFTFWDIFIPPTATTLTIPPVFASKPMFGDGFYAVNVEMTRFPLPGFDYATLFDQDLPGNVAAVEMSQICGGDASHFFLVGTLLTPDAGRRLHLRERLESVGTALGR
jgi:hypothetical protein